MADVNSTVKTTVVLDATQAQQEIAKFNATASDGTKKLEDRVAAKNKAVDLQNKLAKQNVNNLNKEVTELKKNGAELGKVLKAETKLNKAKIAASKTSANGAKQLAGMTQKLKDSKSATKQLDKGMGGLLSSMKLILANPLGLFLAAITSAFLLLKKALTSSEEGQNKLAKGMAVLGSVFDNILDKISDFANTLIDVFSDPKQAIIDLADLIKQNIINRFEGMLELIPQLGKAIKQLFSGDFSGAAETAVNAVAKVTLGTENLTDSIRGAAEALADFGKEVEEDANKAASIADKRAKADKLERELVVQRAKSVRDINELREKIARRDKFTREERMAFAQEAGAINDAISKKEIEAAQLRLEAISEENTLANSNKAALDAEAEAKAKLFMLDAKRLKLQKTLGSEISILNLEAEKEAEKIEKTAEKVANKKEAQRLKDEEAFKASLVRKQEILLEADEIELERKTLNGEDTLALEETILLKKMEMELAILGLSEQEKANIRAKYDNQRVKETKATGKAESKINKIINNEKVQGAMAVGNAISSLAASVFEDNKAAQIGAIGIQTVTGAAGAFASTSGAYPSPFGPILGAISAAAVIAGGVKAIADVKAQKPGKRGSSPRISNPISAVAQTSSIDSAGANNAARLGIDPSLGQNSTASAANNVQGGASNQVQFSEEKYTDFQGQVAFKEEKTTVG